MRETYSSFFSLIQNNDFTTADLEIAIDVLLRVLLVSAKEEELNYTHANFKLIPVLRSPKGCFVKHPLGTFSETKMKVQDLLAKATWQLAFEFIQQG